MAKLVFPAFTPDMVTALILAIDYYLANHLPLDDVESALNLALVELRKE